MLAKTAAPPSVSTPLADVPAIEVAQPARRRFRLVRAYAAALRVAFSYLGFETLAFVLGPAWARRRRPALHRHNGRRVRRAVLRLRGLFIKAGQLASVLTNLLPEPFRAELEGLQDRVPASPTNSIRARIVSEFGAEPETLFLDFAPTPVASASLAQVHRARFAAPSAGDGVATVQDVAVKVQHADIEAIARLDLRAIETILRAVGRWFGIRGLRDQFREIESIILGELDFTREAANAAEISANLGAGVSVPAVVPERSTRRVLTTAFVDGIKAGDLPALDAAGIDRAALAERILDAYGRMIFHDGLYHADPHPGNLLVRPDASQPDGFELVFLDFGAVARLTPAMRHGLAEMIAGTLAQDPRRVTGALTTMGFVPEMGGTEAQAAVLQFVERAHERVLQGMDPDALRLGDLTLETALASKADAFADMADLGLSIGDLAGAFRVPRDWILLERTALLLLGLCTALDPDANPLRVLRPHIEPLVDEAAPAAVEALWSRLGREAQRLLGLPARLDAVLRQAEAGTLVTRQPDTLVAADRVAAGLRQLAYTVGAAGAGGVGYAAHLAGDGGLAVTLVVVAGGCVLGAVGAALRQRRRR